MTGGDTPVLFVYPPEELSDESVHAIHDFLYAVSESFERQYARQLRRPPYTREDRISEFECEEDQPF